MPRGRKNKGWRLGGQNAPRWLLAPATPKVKGNTREDLTLLQRTFDFDELPVEHPVRLLWNTDGDAVSLAEARFEFHHLASDLRAIAGVPGAARLVDALLKDVAGYANYRYELRVAGSVGRSTTQRLVSLGGKDEGPDIEVVTRSGHTAGIACYRASSTTPALLDSGSVHRRLTMQLGEVIARAPLFGHRVVMTLEFERFPVSDAVAASAAAAFEEVWTRHNGSPEAARDGVKVMRTAHEQLPYDVMWDVRVQLKMPVPGREKYRIANNIRDKLAHEQTHWASTYSGVPVLCVEESDFCLGLEKDDIEPHLQPEAPHSFQGIIATQQFFGNGTRGARHRLEQIDFSPRQPGVGLDLGFETFGENFESFGDGHGVITFAPKHAEEVWQLFSGAPPLGFAGHCVKPLSLRRDFHRLPVPIGQDVTPEQLKPILRKIIPGFADRPE
ncbi:MAG: hypothetical protein AB7P03_22810 [Kofleriaceae bacterium]